MGHSWQSDMDQTPEDPVRIQSLPIIIQYLLHCKLDGNDKNEEKRLGIVHIYKIRVSLKTNRDFVFFKPMNRSCILAPFGGMEATGEKNE